MSASTTGSPGSEGTENVVCFDRGALLSTSRPLNKHWSVAKRQGHCVCRPGRGKRSRPEPDPEAAHTHFELGSDGGARPPDLGEGLPARGAHDHRGTPVVTRRLPQLIDE